MDDILLKTFELELRKRTIITELKYSSISSDISGVELDNAATKLKKIITLEEDIYKGISQMGPQTKFKYYAALYYNRMI
jgi:hypothetical protein